jgi:hypothetical protein
LRRLGATPAMLRDIEGLDSLDPLGRPTIKRHTASYKSSV